MTYYIQSGRHGGFHFPKLTSIRNKELKYRIRFNDTCQYNIGEDQSDVNKLFGIGYLPWHRQNSVRFGWRYVLERGKIEILAYWYKSGQRHYQSMFHIEFGKWYDYSISKNNNSHKLIIYDTDASTLAEHIVELTPQLFGYKLFPYFGGNKTAPHTMSIDMVGII